jgi:hypothetical protein
MKLMHAGGCASLVPQSLDGRLASLARRGVVIIAAWLLLFVLWGAVAPISAVWWRRGWFGSKPTAAP